MTDLDAIRARAKAASVIEGFPEHDHSPAALDREWLLAEVDRLTALNFAHNYEEHDCGTTAERARIAGAIRSMNGVPASDSPDVERAAVLAIVEGEA